MNRFSIISISVLLAFVVGLSACNDTFEPLQENNKYVFSMYGTIDVTADTQWVRVMPIGDRLFNDDPTPNGTVVTLKNLDSGVTVTLNDSMFVFGGPSYVWNYWTTTEILPETMYEVRATATDGRSSVAVVRTPKTLTPPNVIYNMVADRGEVSGASEDRLVVAEVTYWAQFLDDFGRWTDPEKYIFSVRTGAAINNVQNTFRFSFESRVLLPRAIGLPSSRIRIRNMYVRVGTSRFFWPSYLNLSEEEAIMPDVISNVDDGTGYIATVSSHYLPVPSGYSN